MKTQLTPMVKGREVMTRDASSGITRGRAIPSPLGITEDSVLDIVAIWRILMRRRIWILGSVAILMAGAGLLCVVMTPRYRAKAQLQLLKQNLGGEVVNDKSGAPEGSDALDFNLTLQTDAAILQSDTLALQVLGELHLTDSRDFLPRPWFGLGRPGGGSLPGVEESPARKAYVLKRWFSSLSVDAVPGTRLINVSYTNPDPRITARIVNQLLSDFVERNFQVRYNAVQKTADWLGRQLDGFKAQVERSQENAVRLQKDAGIFGESESSNEILTGLDVLNSQLAIAQANRAMKEAVLDQVRTGNPELAASLLGSGSSAPITASPATQINALRQTEANLEVQFADLDKKYGSAYPRVIETRAQLDAIRTSIREEIGKIAGRAENEYEVALATERQARDLVQQQRALASTMLDKSIGFQIAKHEADSSRAIYEALLQRLKEAGVLAGLRSSDVDVVVPASVPARPYRPNSSLYLLIAGLVGLTIGIGCAFIVDTMDSTLRNPEDIETTTQVPVLGIIPRADRRVRPDAWRPLLANRRNSRPEGHSRPSTLSESTSVVAEAFRAVRTSLLLARPDNPAKVFLITSALPSEGKSFASLHLAAALAQNNSRVLMADADLRRGTLSRSLKHSSQVGLSKLLFQNPDEHTYDEVERVPGLFSLRAGMCPPNPAELLGSNKMASLIEKWRQDFDYILIDTPPVLAVTDAVALSAHVDGVVLVVRFAVTTRQSIVRAIRLLRDVNAECLGALVNDMDVQSPDYFYYSGSYGKDHYGYGAKHDPGLNSNTNGHHA